MKKMGNVFLILMAVSLFGGDDISGKVVLGYRVLDVVGVTGKHDFTVFRGDYIKFNHGRDQIHLSVPVLKIEKDLPQAITNAPYFKMRKVGEYDYVLGDLHGTIKVLEFEGGTGYQELNAEQSQVYLEKEASLVLDVRTRGEYKRAHLKGAIVLPVQELQARYAELEKYKNQKVFIYCATGNRSTVASKILIDHGFKSITNMRYGIKDWMAKKNPVEK